MRTKWTRRGGAARPSAVREKTARVASAELRSHRIPRGSPCVFFHIASPATVVYRSSSPPFPPPPAAATLLSQIINRVAPRPHRTSHTLAPVYTRFASFSSVVAYAASRYRAYLPTYLPTNLSLVTRRCQMRPDGLFFSRSYGPSKIARLLRCSLSVSASRPRLERKVAAI